MPWDAFSASRQGSIAPYGSAATGVPLSIGGPSRGFEVGQPSSLSRRGSRFTTASPLQGRGPPLSHRISILNTPEGTRGGVEGEGGEDDLMLGMDLPVSDETGDFQLPGPEGSEDVQTAAQKQWIAAALDSESQNFLDFLDARIQEQMLLPEGQEEQSTRHATFEGLLLPGEHSKEVAATAFLHVLSLASKHLVHVKQDDFFFGEIELAIAIDV
jgi:Conserved region of Rad21 / Rec8 like protein